MRVMIRQTVLSRGVAGGKARAGSIQRRDQRISGGTIAGRTVQSFVAVILLRMLLRTIGVA
jgi:hypothetical protein